MKVCSGSRRKSVSPGKGFPGTGSIIMAIWCRPCSAHRGLPTLPSLREPWPRRRMLERRCPSRQTWRSEEHTSELQSLMRISYAVFCLKKKNQIILLNNNQHNHTPTAPTHPITLYLHSTRHLSNNKQLKIKCIDIATTISY